MHIPKYERSKLDVKTWQCIFVGYGQNEFGYMLYDPIETKIIRSQDVVFIEDQIIEDIDKTEESVSNSSNDLVDLDLIHLTPYQHIHKLKKLKIIGRVLMR